MAWVQQLSKRFSSWLPAVLLGTMLLSPRTLHLFNKNVDRDKTLIQCKPGTIHM